VFAVAHFLLGVGLEHVAPVDGVTAHAGTDLDDGRPLRAVDDLELFP
jgi:hypothetical protein